MVRINISNDPSDRIVASFPYDPLLVARVKTIDSRRWHPAEKHWSFPKTGDILEQILKVFGHEEAHLHPDLQAKSPTLKGTAPDLRAQQSVVVESGLSPKYDFEDLRKELVSVQGFWRFCQR